MTVLKIIEPDWFDVIIFLIMTFIIVTVTACVVLDSVLWGLCLGAIITVSMSGIVIPIERNNKNVRYEVTFDDDVKINDILGKYEIVDQNGSIYTIKEKIK